ncbi:nuclear transport factor 2 family protein [Sphaerisporangium sp. TRM90804]|uniref:nuclear transport factor 2 family protein n=1 Tax=Sphaerisporangium sp. TRM90804 TaxID=3031113 RepID=UPI00244B9FD0|nr:nuclear transport factor 2 family protein [Sphaerisporangium sp. TRM90804]MDH2427995.1 nuclear transport factor 2 family protein [Sphaerisporangium sp. TRM90804]
MTTTADGTRPATAQVHRLYELIDAGDFTGVASLFAPHATYHRPGQEVMAGRDAIERFYFEKRAIRSGAHTVATVVESGGDVAVRGSFSGTLVDGSEVSHRFAEFFELTDDGLFSRRDSFLFTPSFKE